MTGRRSGSILTGISPRALALENQRTTQSFMLGSAWEGQRPWNTPHFAYVWCRCTCCSAKQQRKVKVCIMFSWEKNMCLSV